jgi:PIN domain nuclease of toxin-antitoxin system
VNLLLDTCALIWLASEPARLGKSAVAAINDQAAVLHVSHASLWEIILKHGAGKLTLPEPPREWWADQIAKWSLIELPLTTESLLRGSELPPHHKDPFDRVILGEAIIHGLQVVSPDGEFAPYGVSLVW